MACFHPLEAYQLEDKRIVFREQRNVLRALWLPCGRCVGCRSVRARSWAIRCMHEASLYDANSFITLTYSDDVCPVSLEYKGPLGFQRFMYRVRAKYGPVRFFMCGEYGELNYRPHFHALLFGVSLDASALEKLWKFGFSYPGEVTRESAGYVARYAMKKRTGDMADIYYRRVDERTGELVYVEPEFGRMSLKPGIGYGWFQKYWKDVYKARDGIVQPGGFTVPPPRFYDRLLAETCPSLASEKEVERYINSQRFVEDCTPQRLLVREHCARAREAFRRRSL